MTYTAQQIAAATGAPLANVQATWPPTLDALTWQGINTHAVRVAMAATIAVETGVTENGKNMTFLPVVELGGQNSWYAPWYGRGTIQCTLEANYRAYGPRLHPPIDLIAHPDALLGQVASAQFAALYFVDHAINVLAAQGNWVAVRVRVNGGNGVDRENGGTTNGLNSFLSYVNTLLAISESADDPVAGSTWRVVTKTDLLTKPQLGAPNAIDANHHPVVLPVGAAVISTGQNTPHWAEVKLPNSPVHGWCLRTTLRA